MNKIQCKLCGDIIESKHVHDLVFCKCRAIFVDGGDEYRRRGGDLLNIIEIADTSDDEIVDTSEDETSGDEEINSNSD